MEELAETVPGVVHSLPEAGPKFVEALLNCVPLVLHLAQVNLSTLADHLVVAICRARGAEVAGVEDAGDVIRGHEAGRLGVVGAWTPPADRNGDGVPTGTAVESSVKGGHCIVFSRLVVIKQAGVTGVAVRY